MKVESDDTSKSKRSAQQFQKRGAAMASRSDSLTNPGTKRRSQTARAQLLQLRLDHAVKVQLTAARERQVFCCVRE